MKKFKNRSNKSYNVGDKTVWESRSVAVNCLVIFKPNTFLPDYYILAEKRGSALDHSGKWCFPCGYLDWDETVKEAVVREVFEETGLDLDYFIEKNKIIVNNLDKPWYIDSNPISNRQNITLRHACVIEDEKLPIITTKYSEPNEISELRWINIDDIAFYDWAFEHDKIIKEYIHKYV